MFTNTPCKPTCLCNTPSLHTFQRSLMARLCTRGGATIGKLPPIPSLGDKIQGPSWGQQKRRNSTFWHLLDPRFEWLEVAEVA